MKTISIIAEFNPFHKGHLHLIKKCKEDLNADYCIIVMSGDFVQRGAPAIMDKFTRTEIALSCGADIVIELPVYYSTGSAEFFAGGAVSILNGLGVVDNLCFGSECNDITALKEAATILNEEPAAFKESLSDNLKKGLSFPLARQKSLSGLVNGDSEFLSMPNNILAIEYIRALLSQKSSIVPHTISRIGEGYNSAKLSQYSSATAIREYLFTDKDHYSLSEYVPAACADAINSYSNDFASVNGLSKLLHYTLIQNRHCGYEDYLDVSRNLSNKIAASLDDFTDFDSFCELLKSKDIAYSRISRSLLHILLDIRKDNMEEYKAASYAPYARILGMRKSAAPLMKEIGEKSSIPVFSRLKDSNTALSPLQKRLLDETLSASSIYNLVYSAQSANEYRRKNIII